MPQLAYYCKVFKLPIVAFIFLLFTSFQKTEELTIGDQAPDFSMVAMNGETIHLSQLKGTIVFVDFWASWCLPCRKQNLLLSKIYDKYKRIARRYDMKVVFISVSLDTNKELWRVAVSKDNLDSRKQVCDFSGWDSPIAKNYHIKKVPSSFLLDTNGKIVSKDIWDEALTGALDKMIKQLSN